MSKNIALVKKVVGKNIVLKYLKAIYSTTTQIVQPSELTKKSKEENRKRLPGKDIRI